IVSFMQGYVMGGGVGVGGHVSHRVVGASTRLAMPECAIGMIPDVGGTWLLGRAPGRVGEYLGLTGARIEAADAIFAGFADLYIPEAEWPGLIADLCDSGDADLVRRRAQSPGEAPLETRDLSAFGGRDPAEIIARLEAGGDGESAEILRRASPMSLAVTLLAVRAARGDRSIQQSLARELRYTARATRQGEFLEGVRAQIIDKDRRPNWRPAPSADEAAALLAPLQSGGLDWD
ncbi:MAG: enoyl-CoA hydratase/isomerase family protein, partial [Paracoccus sp. (in: a-proteobacteria)]|nr:enoyl-CoA hydratase/isomerase family protein [Paracoccus sp. (in: a-proteobacteria)]